MPLSNHELAAVQAGIRFDDTLEATLRDWVGRWYPEELREDDLADPIFATSLRDASQELTGLLDIGSISPFQK